jgi:DNA (cytosine-5)-methyltransferase 1
MTFKLIDLFAGPGGLGEGFAALDNGKKFEIGVSAEMESSAHRTLTLRSLFRHLKQDCGKKDLQIYYDYCNSPTAPHPEIALQKKWKLAGHEAQLLELGNQRDNDRLDQLLIEKTLLGEGIVVIGGPPCQAYSLMGRAKNMGTIGYVPEEDKRHYLYKQYLRILDKAKPVAFVMENVKGILSSRVGGRQVFHDILQDLTDPSKALGGKTGIRYTIHSLVVPMKFEYGMDPTTIDAHDFIVRADQYGLPQARHRVILLGIREEMKYDGRYLLRPSTKLLVEDAIKELPALRSRLSHKDDPLRWRETVIHLGQDLANDATRFGDKDMSRWLTKATASVKSMPMLDSGSQRYRKGVYSSDKTPYTDWVRDDNLDVWLNHQARSHMDSDLRRYLYAAAFANQYERSPKGHAEFMLKGLAPEHANWMTGKFADRFRVQRYGAPSTTVTSHISKDGHYFIHPDPAQCRSLTAREAARLQTFPDNYFFQGNRTQQYHQVGNAVPPFLAVQIAEVVASCLG